MFRAYAVIFGSLLWGLFATPFASAQFYVTALGVLPGGTASYALGVNDSGAVVGSSFTNTTDASTRAFIFSGGTLAEINDPYVTGNTRTFANAINDSGLVGGYSWGGSGTDAFYYQTSNGQFADVGAQPGAANGGSPQCGGYPGTGAFLVQPTPINQYVPGALNSSGVMAGQYATSGGQSGAYYSSGGSTYQWNSPAANGAGNAWATGIDDGGGICGSYQVGTNTIPVGFYTNGGGAVYQTGAMNYPLALSGSYLVGTDSTTDKANVYSVEEGMLTIGTLPGDEYLHRLGRARRRRCFRGRREQRKQQRHLPRVRLRPRLQRYDERLEHVRGWSQPVQRLAVGGGHQRQRGLHRRLRNPGFQWRNGRLPADRRAPRRCQRRRQSGHQ